MILDSASSFAINFDMTCCHHKVGMVGTATVFVKGSYVLFYFDTFRLQCLSLCKSTENYFVVEAQVAAVVTGLVTTRQQRSS
jgi:hypothetical protein